MWVVEYRSRRWRSKDPYMLKEGSPILWNWKPCHKENGPHLNLSRTVVAARVVIVITSVLFILWEQHELQRLGPSRPIIFTVRGKNAKESQELGIWWDLKVKKQCCFYIMQQLQLIWLKNYHNHKSILNKFWVSGLDTMPKWLKETINICNLYWLKRKTNRCCNSF